LIRTLNEKMGYIKIVSPPTSVDALFSPQPVKCQYHHRLDACINLDL